MTDIIGTFLPLYLLGNKPVKQKLLYDQGRDPNSKHRFLECRISLNTLEFAHAPLVICLDL